MLTQLQWKLSKKTPSGGKITGDLICLAEWGNCFFENRFSQSVWRSSTAIHSVTHKWKGNLDYNFAHQAFQSLCHRGGKSMYSSQFWDQEYILWGAHLVRLIDVCDLGESSEELLNTLRPRQNGRHFTDDIFKCIFFNENVWILIKIILKCNLNVRIINIAALVQIMAWRRSVDKPLPEPMMVRLLTHI